MDWKFFIEILPHEFLFIIYCKRILVKKFTIVTPNRSTQKFSSEIPRGRELKCIPKYVMAFVWTNSVIIEFLSGEKSQNCFYFGYLWRQYKVAQFVAQWSCDLLILHASIFNLHTHASIMRGGMSSFSTMVHL